MADIEFVDQHEPPPRVPAPDHEDLPGAGPGTDSGAGPGAGPTGRRLPPVLVLWAPAVPALAAVVLAVVTSFQRVFALAGIAGSDQIFFAVDAWGRYSVRGIPPAAHGSRYGVVLVAGALLVLAGAALRVLVSLRRRDGHRHPLHALGTSVLVGGVGLLGGGVAAAWLEVSSVTDTYRDQLRVAGEQSLGRGPHAITGPVVALGLVAVLLGLLAAVLPPVLQRVSRDHVPAGGERTGVAGYTGPGPAAPAPESGRNRAPSVPHPDDEVLDA